MAFNQNGFGPWSTSFPVSGVLCFGYKTTVDTLATVVTDGYFDLVNSGNPDATMNINDLIYIQASDGRGFYFVDAISPNIGVTILP